MSYSSVTGNKDKQPPSSSSTGVKEEFRRKVKETIVPPIEKESQSDDKSKSSDPSTIEQVSLTESLSTDPYEVSQPDTSNVEDVTSPTSGEDERMKQIEKVLYLEHRHSRLFVYTAHAG